MLHSVAIHDDDIGTTLLDLAAADFVDGEDTVQDRSEDARTPLLPTLRDIDLGEYDEYTARVFGNSRLLLQPTNWPESRTIQTLRTLAAGSIADVTAGDAGPVPYKVYDGYGFPGRYNTPLPKTLNWVNPGNSQWVAGIAATDMLALLHMSYAPVIPVPAGGRPLIIVKAAGGDQSAADVWAGDSSGAGGFDERLDDDSPGLDASLTYLLSGLGGRPQAAGDDILEGIRWLGKSGNKVTPSVLGPGNIDELMLTHFTYDTAPPIEGSDAVQVQTLAAVTHTPDIVLEFLELAAAPQAGRGGTTPIRPSAAAGRAGAGPTGGAAFFGGLGR